MADNDRDIWNEIQALPGLSPELRYLSYAIYSSEKFDWVQQFEKRNTRVPTQAEIDQWISQVTALRVGSWRDAATRTFDNAARTYMESDFEKRYLKDKLVLRVDEVAKDLSGQVSAVQAEVTNRVGSMQADLTNRVGSVRDEIKKGSSFGNAFLISVLTAILTPLILGLIVVLIRAADLWPTPTQIEKYFDRATHTGAPSP
jgi:hypothetical protein